MLNPYTACIFEGIFKNNVVSRMWTFIALVWISDCASPTLQNYSNVITGLSYTKRMQREHEELDTVFYSLTAFLFIWYIVTFAKLTIVVAYVTTKIKNVFSTRYLLRFLIYRWLLILKRLLFLHDNNSWCYTDAFCWFFYATSWFLLLLLYAIFIFNANRMTLSTPTREA